MNQPPSDPERDDAIDALVDSMGSLHDALLQEAGRKRLNADYILRLLANGVAQLLAQQELKPKPATGGPTQLQLFPDPPSGPPRR